MEGVYVAFRAKVARWGGGHVLGCQGIDEDRAAGDAVPFMPKRQTLHGGEVHG